jgi:hypothetical protein
MSPAEWASGLAENALNRAQTECLNSFRPRNGRYEFVVHRKKAFGFLVSCVGCAADAFFLHMMLLLLLLQSGFELTIFELTILFELTMFACLPN